MRLKLRQTQACSGGLGFRAFRGKVGDVLHEVPGLLEIVELSSDRKQTSNAGLELEGRKSFRGFLVLGLQALLLRVEDVDYRVLGLGLS